MFEYGNQKIEYNILKNECWECMKRHVGVSGYPQIRFNNHLYNVHRLVFIFEKNNGVDLPKEVVVRHTCDNPLCINPEHLLSGTQTDNMRDCSKRGRIHGGQLSDNTIKYIRLSVKYGFKKQIQLAKEFGLTRGQISEIINYRTYKNI